MDEEDLADAEEARGLETKDSFSGLGSTQEDKNRLSIVTDLFRGSGDTKGIQLLRKMGWRDGQGVGPKVRRRARLEDGGDSPNQRGEAHLFAPDDPPMITLVRKDDTKGLGFQRESRLDGHAPASNGAQPRGEESATGDSSILAPLPAKKQAASGRGGFGVGILNDNGSDEEDSYALGPKISYNRTIGGDKKKKKSGAKFVQDKLEQSSRTRPILFTKKADKLGSNFRKCHDGRLPLDGFTLASKHPSISTEVKFPPQTVPESWKTSKTQVDDSIENSQYRSTTDLAKASGHDPSSRSLALGETPLLGQSVFDFMTPNARSRIVTLTKNESLPVAGWEQSARGSADPSIIIPALDPQVAATALGRGTAGFIPYSDNLEKLSRYRAFLSYRAGLTPEAPVAPSITRRDDWQRELQEFAHAATIFKPMTGSMASRFTSSNEAGVATSQISEDNGEKLLSKPKQKPLEPAEEAAKVGMFGPMTRASAQFYPSRLLCKRFNVPVPTHVTAENEGSDANVPTQAYSSAREPQVSASEPVPNFGSRFTSSGFQADSGKGSELLNRKEMETLAREAGLEVQKSTEEPPVDPDRNEALEAERPGDAVFKAIFGSDSEET